MAESSSAVPSSAAYDVFLNHRGPDVKKSFASHLYRRLLSYGLRVFLDQPELNRGDYFIPQIEDAIRSASVHVAIFSVGYVDSIWCLNELVQMLDSKAPIIPVFYYVKPTELRRTRGRETGYAKALEKHESKTDEYNPQTPRYDSSTIEKWRNVLSKVADISGFELEACNGDEGELVDKVVERVLKKVKKPALALDVAKYPTGLDDKVKEFENSVLLPQQQRGKPQIFGIVGLGGVGKTTMAKEFFNRKNSEYHRHCFLSDVKDNKGCLNLLQKILLNSLTGSDNSVNSVHEGIGMLKMHLSSANALVIIDDVDHENQVYALWPHQTVNLHSDSLILITSRNKDVLKRSGVEESSIYNLTGLTTPHSLELFCLHSFNQPHPPREFESLVNEFLKACSGLPLSLKVFGALLNGKNTFYWEYQLNKLGRILPKDIKQVLKISYDSLDLDEKQIFLDIACFFIGEDRDMTVKIWDNGLCGFQNIQNRCLVEVNSEKEIKMHDHVRDLGREIADADASLPRRLWRPTEKIDDLLQQSSVVRGIRMRGIRMLDHTDSDSDDDSSAMPWLQRSSELFGNCVMKLCNMLGNMQYPFHGTGICMKKLQLLDTEDVLVDNVLRKVQSPNLIWLRLNNCPYSSLPSSISMKNLRVLQVRGEKLKTLWKTESQAPSRLRELRIDAPLSNIPKSIGQLRHLERIVITPFLGSRPRTTEIPQMKSLPECFGHLTNLQQIQLKGCKVLERLPDSFGNLSNLQHIELSECSALERLPDSFGKLMKLQYLDLKGCSALKSLPDSFGKLMKLQYLDLKYCINLTISSETLGNINTLEYINLSGCKKIEVLPPQVARQRSLEQLHLEESNLKELPSAIGELSNLEVLKVGILDTLPPSLCDLKNLKELSIFHCRQLKCLPASLGDLRNLEKLFIGYCLGLKCLLASLGLLTQLTELTVFRCPLIRELPLKVKGERETLSDLDSSILPRLQHLAIRSIGISEVSFAEGVCFNLRTLQVHGLAKLQKLNIMDCIELEELQGIETLVSLTSLRAIRCVKLKSIRGLGQLTKLQQLVVRNCYELEEVEGIQDCMLLRSLYTTECPKLQWSAVILEQLRQRVRYLII